MTGAAQPLLAYGYARLGEGTKISLDEHRDRISQFAGTHGLMLDRIFTDTALCPALQRPGLRSLLTAAFELRPVVLVVPTPWHLAQDRDELAQIMLRLGASDCRVLVLHRPKKRLAPGRGSSSRANRQPERGHGVDRAQT